MKRVTTMQDIALAPRAPLDAGGQGPTLWLYPNHDAEPVLGWWGARKGWRDGHGALSFMPQFWAPLSASATK